MRMGTLCRSGRLVACAAFLLAIATAGAQTVTVPLTLVGYPDLIVHNGKIVTMDDASLNPTTGRTVQAMAIRQGKSLALGSNAEMLGLAGPQTRRIDLRGRTNTPVMLNAHPNWMLNKTAEDSILGLYGRENTPENREVFVPVFNTTINRSLVVDCYFASRIPELADIIQGGLSFQLR